MAYRFLISNCSREGLAFMQVEASGKKFLLAEEKVRVKVRHWAGSRRR